MNSRGYTLIEILIALALIIIVGGAAAAVSRDVLLNVRRAQVTATRDLLAVQWRQAASRPGNLKFYYKKPENLKFYNCLCGVGTCAITTPEDLVLYDSENGGPVSTHYDIEGNSCNETDPNCTIEVITKFTAQCLPLLPSTDPTPLASCSGVPAEFISVNYIIQENHLAPAQSIALKKVQGSVYLQVANVTTAGICP